MMRTKHETGEKLFYHLFNISLLFYSFWDFKNTVVTIFNKLNISAGLFCKDHKNISFENQLLQELQKTDGFL